MPGSCGEEAQHKKSPFLRCLGPERPKKGDFLCRGSCGEEAHPLLRCFRPERPKKGDFLCRALAGMPGSCGEAFKGSGLRAQGSRLRACGEEARHKKSPFFEVFELMRGRGPAQKVTFFEVFEAGR